MTTVPDLKLHCRQCGGAFWEMMEKLNHPCQWPANEERKPQLTAPKKGRR